MKSETDLHAQTARITALARNSDNEAFKMTKITKNAAYFNFIHQAVIGPSSGRACLSTGISRIGN